MQVNGLHQLSRGGILLTEQVIEEQAVIGDEHAPIAIARELLHGRHLDRGRIGPFAWCRHTPDLLRRCDAAIAVGHPLVPTSCVSPLERLAPPQQVEQVLRPQRLMVNEHAHRVQIHRFDPPQIALNHRRIVGAASHPVFEVMSVRQADPARRHVVNAVYLPRFPLQPEPTISRFDELRLRFRLPDAEIVPQAVN